MCIGSGPAGQKAAVQAAKLGAKVAVISAIRLGGVCINTGTIPSKTLREAVLDLSGLRQRTVYGVDSLATAVTIEQLLTRTREVIQHEREVVRAQLQRNGIDVFHGFGRFENPHEVAFDGEEGSGRISGKYILISVGTVPSIPAGLNIDHETLLTSDDILTMPHLPRRMLVAGAGVIGVEYASMFAALGIDVAICDVRTSFLDMVDGDIRALFQKQLERAGVTFHLGEKIARVEPGREHTHNVVMESGLVLPADVVLVSAGRTGDTAGLQVEKAGLSVDPRGRLVVNSNFQTSVPHIYAAGDVIGAPQLAATSAEQGRLAACHAFNLPSESVPALFPYGIYAIPEIAWCGKSEEELRADNTPYETGIANYREIARGTILGDSEGLLKMLVHQKTRDVLGVWICGSQATELVHIGQAVIALGGKLDYFLRTVFNYPTLAECYKVAALNGMNKLRAQGMTKAAPHAG